MEVTATEKLIKSQQSSGVKKRGRKKNCQQEKGAQTVRDRSYRNEGYEEERAGERVKENK